MEIIVFPYMAISFSIAWTVFSPFAQIEDLHLLTFAKIETSDLIAIFLPMSILWALASWAVPLVSHSFWVVGSAATAILLFTAFSFVTSLFLLAKMNQIQSAQRMAMVGIVIPLGSLLAVGWIAVPVIAGTNSVLLAIPAILSVIPVALVLRRLSAWICQSACAVS